MPFFALAQSNQSETLTITTYYPAPYGVYRNLEVKRGLAIGNIASGPIGSMNNLRPGQLYINNSVILNTLTNTPADSNGKAGQLIYVGGTDKMLKYHNGTAWVNATSSPACQTDQPCAACPGGITGGQSCRPPPAVCPQCDSCCTGGNVVTVPGTTCPNGYNYLVSHWLAYSCFSNTQVKHPYAGWYCGPSNSGCTTPVVWSAQTLAPTCSYSVAAWIPTGHLGEYNCNYVPATCTATTIDQSICIKP